MSQRRRRQSLAQGAARSAEPWERERKRFEARFSGRKKVPPHAKAGSITFLIANGSNGESSGEYSPHWRIKGSTRRIVISGASQIEHR